LLEYFVVALILHMILMINNCAIIVGQKEGGWRRKVINYVLNCIDLDSTFIFVNLQCGGWS
jgi:hypothetical protein